MKSLCVFCGSSSGNDPSFTEAAQTLGRTMAEHKITLVYGGAKLGLMGAVADAVLTNGGIAVGVLPRFLGGKEIAHPGLTELILCETMHERKMKMFQLAEGFLALPGGFGTLEEVVEILTWQQLGLHKFPIGLLNMNGFYKHLDLLFADMERNQLLKAENRQMAIFSNDVDDLLAQMKKHRVPAVPKWISKTST